MRKFSCQDLGLECPWTIYGEDEDEVVRRARDHAREAHHAQHIEDDEPRIRDAVKST
jgi:predicted small metal-binding protein